MKRSGVRSLPARKLAGAALLLFGAAARLSAEPETAIWDAIVRGYVTGDSRVDYARLKREAADRLNRYVASLAPGWPPGWSREARKASLINAYNALTIAWILANYPAESIWRTRRPFTADRHELDARKVSLDAIETELRGMGDPRIHAALVCAARSCPPLRREAYTADLVDRQLEENTRVWLADRALNDFMPERRVAEVSSIFDWYGGDFSSVREFLARYAPPGRAEFLLLPGSRIRHKRYDWGLNDTSELGSRYSKAKFLWDRARNAF